MIQEDLSKYNPEGSILRRAQLRELEILIEVEKYAESIILSIS